MTNKIEPRTLKGFRDYLPGPMLAREKLIETARRVYRLFGYSPIDTPALEYLEILAGKGGEESDRQLYKFCDRDKRWVGLRFDLTVPLARFAAQHINDLGTPFKRYHIATVWRGENTHRGRYREFMQCDFDTIGTRSAASDIETGLVIHELLRAIGLDAFTLRLNNRMVLSGLLESLGLLEKAVPVLRALDKLGKVGREAVAAEMQAAAGVSEQQAAAVLKLAEIAGDSDQVLRQLESLVGENQRGKEGVARLAEVIAGMEAAGVPRRCVQIDAAIARGLDYYTGTIYETYLDALPAIGSVCSGGRYDNLAELFTNQELPGVGASLGLDRLLAAMDELGILAKDAAAAPVFIPFFDPQRLPDYLKLAAALRAAGIGAEVFPDPKKLGQQLKYADRKGFRVALIAGSDEFAAGKCQVKDLASGGKNEVALDDGAAGVIAEVRRILA